MSPATFHRRALEQRIRPTRVEVDLGALVQNLMTVKGLAPSVEVLAVVKANAYGHGAVPVAHALEKAGVRLLGVALAEEGLELRNAGIQAPILVLGGSYEGGYEAMVGRGLIPTVFRIEHLEGLERAASAQGAQAAAHLKVDTGMGRIGVLPEELPGFLVQARRFPHVKLDGLLSHFANADLADRTMTSRQVVKFRDALQAMRAHGLEPRYRHLSNSAGVLSLPEVRDGLELNLVRPGLMLYGVSPAQWLGHAGALQPVLSWKTAVTHVKSVAPGTPISYGGTWVARRESIIATLPVGYADGYGRRYSNRGHVLIRGARAPIAGRVCMDMCMVDVTDVPDVAVGDEVVLMGKQGGATLGVDELAQWADTISYEVLCNVGARVPRVTVDGGP